jgi:hypothetical protein
MVIHLADVPDGWETKGHHRLLVGVQHSELPAAQRARHARLLGLLVRFVDRADNHVGLTSQVPPYPSPADAAGAFEKANGRPHEAVRGRPCER